MQFMQGTIRLLCAMVRRNGHRRRGRADHPDVPAETISAQPDLVSSLHIDSHLG